MEKNNIKDSNLVESFDRECADFNYKIILVGHQRVGKTSITNRYVNDLFNERENESKMV
jgi:GTPase SAR1 family protein